MHPKNLHSASFRGVSFLTTSAIITEGRNSIVHNYPDQAMRYAEDNGAIPPCFELPITLQEPNLPGKLRRLRTALMRPGPGVLRHQVDGSVFVQVDQTYSINQTLRDSGVIELSVKFITTGPAAKPGLTTGVAAVVSQLSTTAIQKTFDTFIEEYNPSTMPYSISEVASSIGQISGTIINVFGQVSGAAKQLNSKSGVFAQNMELADTLWRKAYTAPIEDETIPNSTLVTGFNRIREEAQNVIQIAEKVTPSTRDLAARKQSIQTIGEYNELAAFLSMSEAMASREYVTSDEVSVDEILLETSYSSLQERNTPSNLLSDAFNVFIATSDILERSSVRLPQLTEINAHGTPSSVLAYMLYEQDGMNHSEIAGKAETIVNLNSSQNPAFLGEKTSVLTVV